MLSKPSSVLALLILAGCPGSIDEPGVFTGDATCDVLAPFYISHTCLAGCHSADRAEAELDLETEPLRKRLVGKRGSNGGCRDYAFVNPDVPEESLVYLKLGLSGPVPCGDPMPLFGHPPPQRQVDCLLEWISGDITPAE